MFWVDPQEGTLPVDALLVVLLWSLPLTRAGRGRGKNAQPLSGMRESEITLSLFSLQQLPCCQIQKQEVSLFSLTSDFPTLCPFDGTQQKAR